MAKQTFTTGQVLTAAQMTSLQQTAMLGGAASAKTASYTLVAADAGTAITMSNASATTITVNTALFAAGDTVQITNLGAGVCTITAGTATVNTASSLALAQYESGTLDFISASSAVFLKADSVAASSGSMTLISTTTLTGASVTLSSIPQTYLDLRLVIRDFYPATDNQTLQMTFNGDTGSNYTFVRTRSTSTAVSENVTASNFPFNDRITQQDGTDSNARAIVNIYDYTQALDQVSDGIFVYLDNAGATPVVTFGLTYFPSTSAAITSITINVNSGNLGGGTVLLYGVK